MDGTELHFQQFPKTDTSNCAYWDKTYCPSAWGSGGKDILSGGKAALTKVVSAQGHVTLVSYRRVNAVLLSLQDEATGSTIELKSSSSSDSL